MDRIKIGSRYVGAGEPTYVIAEAGSNHNGNLTTAKELIDVAAEAGADAVKFQTFRADSVYVKDSGTAEHLDGDRDIYEIIEDLEMSYDWIPELFEHCRANDVDFLSSATDRQSLDVIEEYVPALKIPSYTMSHVEFLDYAAQKDKPVILSTGVHSFDEIETIVTKIQNEMTISDLVVLHCVAAYPTPLDSINVRVIRRLRDEFNVLSGLSDHTIDPITAPAAAVALDGAVVEKHFTLDRSMKGPDHDSSLEPAELDRMVDAIRKTEIALGSDERPIYDVEKDLYETARRRVHATTDIQAGEVLTRENTAILRSGKQNNGLDPRHYPDILGRPVKHDLNGGSGITWNDIKEASDAPRSRE